LFIKWFDTKKIVFIPPDAIIVNQDFSLYRISDFFNKIGFKTYMLIIDKNNIQSIKYNTKTILVKNKKKLFEHLKKNSYDIIFHRSWMHRYKFANELIEKFPKSILYIKDWQNIPSKEYKLKDR